jgi:hypothetical protein
VASGVTHSYVLNLLLAAELSRVATPLSCAKGGLIPSVSLSRCH